MADYYVLLGVARSASKVEIKTAYRKLAREYHPDVSEHPEAETRFKEINEAYEVLSDDEKRNRYDRFGVAGVNNQPGAGYGGFEEIFEDFFSAFGGSARQGGRRRGPRPGQDRHLDVEVSFEESVFGVEREVEFERTELCDTCAGSGAAPGTQPIKCVQCAGSGEVRQVQQTFLGQMVQVAPCPRCGGRGEVIPTPCTTCKGTGRTRKKAMLSMNIPAGVREGLQIQFRGEGDVGDKDAPRGSLMVSVHVAEHEYFKRRENDVILDININIAQAALGDTVNVPSVDGEVEIVVPPGTQTGRVFRLRGKGIPRLRVDGTNSGRGDQLVYVQVEIPSKLTDDQRALFEQLATTMGTTPTAQPQQKGKGFFDRVATFLAGE